MNERKRIEKELRKPQCLYLGDGFTKMESIIDHTNRWPRAANCHGHVDERCMKTTSQGFRQGKRAPFADADTEVAKIT